MAAVMVGEPLYRPIIPYFNHHAVPGHRGGNILVDGHDASERVSIASCTVSGSFFCIPAGYLILMIYSICNITDQSLGTREVKESSVRVVPKNSQDRLIAVFKKVFFCCFTKMETKLIESQTEAGTRRSIGRDSVSESLVSTANTKTASSSIRRMSYVNEAFDAVDDEHVGFSNTEEDDEQFFDWKGVPVEQWLGRDFKAYDSVVKKFKDNGFENTTFISKMTETELKDIGIKSTGQKHFLMEKIKKLPDFEVVVTVPKDVNSWLNTIGLLMYKDNFKQEQITSSKDMEVLKTFTRSKIELELKITKIGHIKRLMHAIAKLRNPTSDERKIFEVRKELDKSKLEKMRESNQEEHDFWDKLLNLRLVPQSTAYGLEEDLKKDLAELRNKWIAIFAVFNAIWMVLIYSLATKGKLLSVANSNPVGLVVLVIFSFVLFIQFIAMIIHRLTTATHFLARAPYLFGDKYNAAYALNDRDIADKNRPISHVESKQKHPGSSVYM
ncbi:uncharacterized protein LOC127869860 [Dreissena polymorpha]|uniref:uncharacterized protein LOC127869860 n=1 Tax=Dreissena polymorpha TaxID=45954 RepID=UPI0022654B3F|nr:uncharacterized protein LOC127869860 [Dreissena polymorpha]